MIRYSNKLQAENQKTDLVTSLLPAIALQFNGRNLARTSICSALPWIFVEPM